MFSLLEPLADERAMRQARAERTVLAALQGSCQVPLAVYAEPQDDGSLALTGMVGTPDGQTVLRAEAFGIEPEVVGLELADRLKAQGAEAVIASLAQH
jgi:hydroxymethylbilane synthase